MDKGITRAHVERVARIYESDKEAARALDIMQSFFVRLCRQYGIETPYARRQRLRQE